MIRAESLTYSYPDSDKEAVRDLSFEVADGEIFGFLGPSGAGKSTTQRVLIGLLAGYSGAVQVFGRDLPSWGSDYYERIGVSFEFPNHYLKLTGRENLQYFGALYSAQLRQADELLERVGLLEDADVKVGQYSKGMKNRLSIVRALLHQPELLFLDEPTAGLDPLSARRIKDLIQEEADAGRTVFLTTHDMGVADELCDRLAFIVDSEIRRIDSPGDLKLQFGESQVRVETDRGRHQFPIAQLDANQEFQRVLREEDVRTIHSLEATLEQVFLKVTGRELH